jgi:hypothetical protein
VILSTCLGGPEVAGRGGRGLAAGSGCHGASPFMRRTRQRRRTWNGLVVPPAPTVKTCGRWFLGCPAWCLDEQDDYRDRTKHSAIARLGRCSTRYLSVLTGRPGDVGRRPWQVEGGDQPVGRSLFDGIADTAVAGSCGRHRGETTSRPNLQLSATIDLCGTHRAISAPQARSPGSVAWRANCLLSLSDLDA